MKLFSIYDTKAQNWTNPLAAPTDAAAIRQFKLASNDTNTDIGRHPTDYLLYRVGTFSQDDGRLVGEDGICIARAIDLVDRGEDK